MIAPVAGPKPKGRSQNLEYAALTIGGIKRSCGNAPYARSNVRNSVLSLHEKDR